MSDDPFDDIDVDPDEEDDPFADLSAETDDTDADDPADTEADPLGGAFTDEPGPTDGDDPEAGAPQVEDNPFSEPSPDSPEDPPTPDREEDDPFADLAGGTEGAVDDVWDDLSADPEEPTQLSEQTGSRRYSEVSKHQFCEQCPHFSGPPEIACSHEGTDIVEFVDMETVRVADCPIVEEREELQNQ